MTISRRTAVLTVAALLGLASCGSDAEVTTAASDAAVDDKETTSEASSEEEDHDEEDHSDEEDHGDEDHDDEGHDDDDEDHDDHGDEDHDDHDDEDHDDEDHDDHDDEDHDDHDDEDHDDHDDEDHGSSSGLGAHEHGAAELTVAWSGSDLVIDLISPAFNIVGFETEPATDEEMELFDERTEALTSLGTIVINDEAGCELVDEATIDTEYDGTHSEITASWSYLCDSPDDINELEAAGLFAEFPNLEDLDVQWASDSGQSSAELTPSETALIFE